MENQEIPLHVVFVEAWVKKGDKYLLAKRSSKDDQAAGKWALPGGKVDMELSEEIIEQTLKREVMEEVGLEINNPVYFSSRSFIRSSGHHVVGLSFIVDYVSGTPEPLEDQDEIRWTSIEELDEMLGEHWKLTIEKLRKM